MARKQKKEQVEEVQELVVIPKTKSKRQDMLELALSLGFECKIDNMGLLRFYSDEGEERERIRRWCSENIHDFSWGITIRQQKIESGGM